MQKRCAWVHAKYPICVDYHDREWGVPVHDDRGHFEMLTLEGAQAGLSWMTILRKREGYSKAFLGFDIAQIATFTRAEEERLRQCSSIVRNRLKIASVVSNARCFLSIQQEFGTFDHYIWRFVDNQPILNKWKNGGDLPVATPVSDIISQDLKKRGFRFVGSTIIYAYMQAIGMVNDHTVDCFRHHEMLANLPNAIPKEKKRKET